MEMRLCPGGDAGDVARGSLGDAVTRGWGSGRIPNGSGQSYATQYRSVYTEHPARGCVRLGVAEVGWCFQAWAQSAGDSIV